MAKVLCLLGVLAVAAAMALAETPRMNRTPHTLRYKMVFYPLLALFVVVAMIQIFMCFA